MATVLDILDAVVSEEAVKLPDYYEIVNGDMQETPPMSNYAGQVASRLHDSITR